MDDVFGLTSRGASNANVIPDHEDEPALYPTKGGAIPRHHTLRLLLRYSLLVSKTVHPVDVSVITK